MASRWNLWMWLECVHWLVGVVARRYINFLIILYLLIPTPLVLALFGCKISIFWFMF